jgi:hypothetical protein
MADKKMWLVCGIILVFMVCALAFLPPPFYLVAAFVAFLIGNQAAQSNPTEPSYRNTYHPPIPSAATARVELPERKMPENIPSDLKCPSCGANIKPSDKKCAYCGSSLQPVVDLPEPAKLGGLEIGKSVTVLHPQKGSMAYMIRGRLLYTELWQASQGPNVPWTPTGNYYAGFALEPTAYLLSWQDRYYLLETNRTLTDMDINRDFVPYARQFAQSNQTARVEFSFEGKRWSMVDIGRFAIEFEDGEGLHLHKGAIGRFIHAGSGDMVLVVEDFQSGGSGGQDTLWQGFQVKETDIKF